MTLKTPDACTCMHVCVSVCVRKEKLVVRNMRIFLAVRDRSLITGRRGATKWENRGSESFCITPLQDRVNFNAPHPPFYR